MSNDIGHELDWDSTIEKDSEFTLLPEGDYDFEVITFERARHQGSEKLPPCWKAVIHIKVTAPNGDTTTIKHNLFLHTRTEGMLCAFFMGIGQRKHGEALTMNWNTVPGSRGRCKIGIRKWKSDDGQEYTNNEIKKFYEPASKPVGYQAGRFGA